MNMQISNEFGQYFVRLPLKKAAKIVHGNALKTDWQSLLNTAGTYTAIAAGKYKVIVTNTSTGCSKTSVNDTVVVPCREGMTYEGSVPGAIYDLTINPNPAQDHLQREGAGEGRARRREG